MAQNDVLQVGIGSRVDGEITANVFHVEQTTAGTPTLEDQYNDLKTLVESEVVPPWIARSSNEAAIICIGIQRIAPTTAPKAIFNVNHVGSVASEALPVINSTVHTWYSFLTTRRGRGRKFWSGIPKSAVHRNRLITAAILLEGALATAFQDPWVGTDTFQAGIYSKVGSVFTELGIVTPRVNIKNLRDRKPVPCV